MIEFLQKLLAWVIGARKQVAELKDPLTPPKLPPEVVKVIFDPPPESMNDLVLRICREKSLSKQMTNDLWNTIRVESGFSNNAIHFNRDKYGKITSTDYYLCQINDYWHIGTKKTFPSVQYVHDNPDKVVSWMCDMFRAGKANLWSAYKNGSYMNKYKIVV